MSYIASWETGADGITRCKQGHDLTDKEHAIGVNQDSGAQFCKQCQMDSKRESKRLARLHLREDFANPDVRHPNRLTDTEQKIVCRELKNGASPSKLAEYFNTSLSEITKAEEKGKRFLWT